MSQLLPFCSHLIASDIVRIFYVSLYLLFYPSIHSGTKSTKTCFFPVKLACFKNSTTSWVEFSGGQHHTVCLDAEGKPQLILLSDLIHLIPQYNPPNTVETRCPTLEDNIRTTGSFILSTLTNKMNSLNLFIF